MALSKLNTRRRYTPTPAHPLRRNLMYVYIREFSKGMSSAIDEQGVSWVIIDDELWERATTQEWIGGIPDTWKRR